MFKAKLIEDTAYYKRRRSDFLWMLVSSMLIGIGVNLFNLPVWVMVFVILGFIGVQLKRFKNIEKIKTISSHKIIEMDDSEIRIKNSIGEVKSNFLITNLECIKTNCDFNIPFETMENIKDEVGANFSKNYLAFLHLNVEKRFEFELPSHYMIVQFKKLLREMDDKKHRVITS